jgi:hypothetical protein
MGSAQRVSQRSGLRVEVSLEGGQQVDTGGMQTTSTGEGVELPGGDRAAAPMPGRTQCAGFVEELGGGGGGG